MAAALPVCAHQALRSVAPSSKTASMLAAQQPRPVRTESASNDRRSSSSTRQGTRGPCTYKPWVLWDGLGWRLSPAYDLNATPVDMKPRVLSGAVKEDDPTADLDVALSVCPYFDLSANRAESIVKEVQNAVSKWRKVASTLGLSKAQAARVETALEPGQLRDGDPVRIGSPRKVSHRLSNGHKLPPPPPVRRPAVGRSPKTFH